MSLVGREISIRVSDAFKVNFEREFRDFLMDPKRREMEFPATLDKEERIFIHNFCRNYGIRTKSTGKEPYRKILLKKKSSDNQFKKPVPFKLSDDIAKKLKLSKKNNPISCNKLEPNITRSENDTKGHYLPPTIPNSSYSTKLIDFRMSLPIWDQRIDIMKHITQNQVSLIIGDTGSGKSTQVPQFILDYSRSINKGCKVVVCEPRRIAAAGLAERVAEERNEELGLTVGYQVFLESTVNPNTNLLYCTNGIFLNWLMADAVVCLNSVTHIIVDEVHERDQFTDFLLISLKDHIKMFPNLRLILMSASMDSQLLSEYFDNAPSMEIPGCLYCVQEHYLEDILDFCKYLTPAMQEYLKRDLYSNESFKESIKIPNSYNFPGKEICIDENLRLEIDECIDMCFDNGGDEYFFEMIQFIASNDVSVDYQNRSRFLTVVMAAASHGKLNMVQEFLKLGAKLNIFSKERCTAFDYARKNMHYECYNFMKKYQEMYENDLNITNMNNLKYNTTSNDLNRFLNAYLKTRIDDQIDYSLIAELAYKIHLYDNNDAILIFLPGYDEIFLTKTRIINDDRFNIKPYKIFMLHSQMRIDEQKKVFDHLNICRKIILSTNISETSITINEIVYVIDCGKVKEQYYDVFSNSTQLRTVWISQSCAKQRTGRAGRVKNGFCFRLFSKQRFQQMQKYSIPEILRIPLNVLCLHAKKLVGENSSIIAFLNKAIEPPPTLSIEKAIESLKILGALNDNEQLTDLGSHLLNLTLDPHLGKILIVSTFLKCLDPILTIVSSLAYRNPFVLPSHPALKKAARDARVRLSCNSFSDHMTFIQIFNEWQENGREEFYKNNFVNQSTLEIISSTRYLLLSQLKALGFINYKHPHDIRSLNENSNNWAIIKAALATGLYPNIAYFRKEKLMFSTKNEKKVSINLSSIFRSLKNDNPKIKHSKILPTDWLMFENLTRTNHNVCQIQCCTAITDLTVAVFCGNQMTINDMDQLSGYSELIIDNWLRFSVEKSDGDLLHYLRAKWENILTSRLICLNSSVDKNEEYFISTLTNILMCRDNEFHLVQPLGIGVAPKGIGFRNHVYKKKSHPEKHMKNIVNCPIPDVLSFPPNLENDKFTVNSNNRQIYRNGVNSCNGNHLINNQNNKFNFKNNNNNNFNTYYNESVFGPQVRTINNAIWNIGRTINEFQYIQFPNNNNTSIVNQIEISVFNNNVTNTNDDVVIPFEKNGVDVPYNQDNSNNAVYILIKANNIMKLDLSFIKNTWIFTLSTEKKIRNFLSKNMDVYLIFFIPNSPFLYGLAQLLCEIDFEKEVAKSYSILWKSRAFIPINEVMNKIGHKFIFLPNFILDGFILERNLGDFLYNLFMSYQPYRPIIINPITMPGRNHIFKH